MIVQLRIDERLIHGQIDPKFVNYPINEVGLTDYVYQDAWDFHVQAGSPVLTGAYNGKSC